MTPDAAVWSWRVVVARGGPGGARLPRGRPRSSTACVARLPPAARAVVLLGLLQFAVCARCTGLYAGAAIGAVAAVTAGHARLAAAVPRLNPALLFASVPPDGRDSGRGVGGHVGAVTRGAAACAGVPLGADGRDGTLAAAATTLHYSGWPPRRGLPPPHPHS